MAIIITMKELKTRLSASLNMIKGFCCNGKLCNAWRQIDDNVIEFRQTEDRKIVRVNINDISEISTFHIYDARRDFNKPYPNVITKEV